MTRQYPLDPHIDARVLAPRPRPRAATDRVPADKSRPWPWRTCASTSCRGAPRRSWTSSCSMLPATTACATAWGCWSRPGSPAGTWGRFMALLDRARW